MPRKIHIASQTYQRNWAVNEKIMRAYAGGAEFELRPIANVGWRPRWWGTDRALASAIETQLSRLESEATPFLRDPSTNWPVTGDLRIAVASFIALHVARSPAFRASYDESIDERVASVSRTNPAAERAHREAATVLRSDKERGLLALEYTTSIGALLASMHWSLVHFDGPVLALSDQPVSIIPCGVEDRSIALRVVPSSGLVDTLEIRVPVAPDRALILTWQEGPESAIEHFGTYAHLTSLNASTIAQADAQWFRHPHGTAVRLRPPMLEPVMDPISATILAGYDSRASRASKARLDAAETARQIADSRQIGGVVRLISRAA